jgi:dextranase
MLPTRSRYAAGSPARVEVRDAPGAGVLRVWRLTEGVGEAAYGPGTTTIDLGELGLGGHLVEAVDASGAVAARTAIQVLGEGEWGSVCRYGFVADYRPGRDLAGVADLARRLHLTALQCYDWAYRHADLVGGGQVYADPLGNPVDLATVHAIVAHAHSIGAEALGYAAVYAVGADEWPRWADLGLQDAEGSAYALGDFLRVVDPGAPRWLAHLTADLAAATALVGFDGFHLDQYGWPKAAIRADGTPVDLADGFVAMLRDVRAALPQARLVFNNVNDFPTWATAAAPTDVVYIEVWPPHERLADLAAVVTRARAAAAGKPVVVAAYLSTFATGERSGAEEALRLTMATLWSHGATHLIAGEEGRLLVDPYYVRNHPAAPETLDLLTRWSDFLVAHHDLLLDPGIDEVTGAYADHYNDDVDVTIAGASVGGTAAAGTVWRRVTRTAYGLVVHLVNLASVTDPRWDTPHPTPSDLTGAVLRVRRVGGGTPEVAAADPDGSGRLEPLEVALDGTHAHIALPPLRTWLVVLIRAR